MHGWNAVMKFDYDRICDFENLYRAYLASRRNKRNTREVIEFEMNTGANLAQLREELCAETYRLSGYYHFTIHDPKVREIFALHYRDRIVQHCLCDSVLAPYFETHLIYDNAACRTGKGTLFAINRLNSLPTDAPTNWNMSYFQYPNSFSSITAISSLPLI